MKSLKTLKVILGKGGSLQLDPGIALTVGKNIKNNNSHKTWNWHIKFIAHVDKVRMPELLHIQRY